MSAWQDYIGREKRVTARLDPEAVARVAATLSDVGIPVDPDDLPVGVHWCFGVETVPTLALGPDGHPSKGDFLPPVPLPRRMWAGGSLEFMRPLEVGQEFERQSRISKVSEKTGKSGQLVFVTVMHEIVACGDLVLREEQDIVYRPADPEKVDPAPLNEPDVPTGDWILPDSRLLFRYSAVTFNSHRIHYDQAYARTAESYPALVVHGPLQATLLAARARKMLGRPLRSFRFRGLAPAFADIPLEFTTESDDGEGLTIVTRQFGRVCMQATAA